METILLYNWILFVDEGYDPALACCQPETSELTQLEGTSPIL